MANDNTALNVPAQSIPVPQSISEEAQAYLASAAQRIAEAMSSSGSVHLDPMEEAVKALEFLRPAEHFNGSVETVELLAGGYVYRITPADRQGRRAEVAYVEIHGGGFVSGGGEMCRLLGMMKAMEYGTEVFSVDYRLLPEHPYPAGLDDCVAAYREVLSHYSSSSIVVSGVSAGGNLAAAMVLRARDEGLPLPAAMLLLTPAVDITLSGDSHQTNRFLDVNLYGGADDIIRQYSGTESPSHPYVSPLFGDFSKGWPPTFLMSGTRDLLLSDTVRMHRVLRRAGVSAELHVIEASPHAGFMSAFAPEDVEMMAECRRFVDAAWGIEV